MSKQPYWSDRPTKSERELEYDAYMRDKSSKETVEMLKKNRNRHEQLAQSQSILERYINHG